MPLCDSQSPHSLSIGALGWWNYDNQGDLAMLSALRQGLAPHQIVPIDCSFPAHPDIIYRLNRLDYVLLGGGTLIPGKPTKPFDTFDRWADDLQCPLGVIGLGIDPFPELYWPAIKALLDRAEFFHVRDQASRALLRDHPKVQVAPDLTFAHPVETGGRNPDLSGHRPRCGVNLRKSPSLDPQPWLETIARLPVDVKGIPLSSFGIWTEHALLKQLDPESPDRFDAALYRKLDLMIGTAFHAILFAVQAAVPVIAVGYAPKVRHFMEDNGLTDFLLAPDEHQRLPELVAEVLAKRTEITADLRAIGARLHQDAQRNIRNVREQIEQGDPPHPRNGPKVTIVIMGTGNAEADCRTLASCASQTYHHVEAKTIAADPQASRGARLQEAIASAEGEYLGWVEGGDWFADDALDCLVSRLEQERGSDVIYTDYYAMNEANLPVGHHVVPGPDKLYRRDVIGPCFLMRRALLARTGWPAADTPLAAYDLWLRASSTSKFTPLHAPLFYSARPIKSPAFIAQEREVRRCWRRSRPVWVRAAWRVVDSNLGERFIVKPLARIRDLLKGRAHARSQ